jgi:predicted Zn-dependent protease
MVPETEIAALRELYEAGQYVTAWRRTALLPPVEQWQNPDALLIAGRLLNNLEDRKRARVLHVRAWRRGRHNPEAAYYRAFAVLERLGPLRALRFLEQLPAYPQATPEQRASFLALRAHVLSMFRDFTRADALLREAEAIDAKRPWIWVERSSCLEQADDYPGALAAAQHALALRPWFRPAVQSAAHLLGLLGRDDEALAFLREASTHLESPSIVAQLAALLVEHERHAEALVEWRRYRELAVAIDTAHLEWWHARMSDALYELGELAEAAEHARRAKDGFHEKIASRLAQPPPEARIVRLQVPFVRQHDMTCAPATLTALSGYWRVNVDHLALAREICYDGTQAHRERHWAEQNGFVAREFTVTWDAAIALLDRGIPFAICTAETRSAHLQAITGYDGVRGTLVIRDPYLKHPGEALGVEWLQRYAFVGPRGLALIPIAEAGRLDGLTLPDAELYDHLHVIERSLFLHDRARAAAALATLEKAAPEHRLTFEARRELAGYDGSQPGLLAATEQLLGLFKDSNYLRWSRYALLRDLARHAERRQLLGELARGEKSEPFFWRELAEDLRADARQLPLARRWLLRALHFQPSDAEMLHAAAGVLWEERRFADALNLYRFAACQRDKVEAFQRSWFIASRHLQKEDEVLAILVARAQREGAKSDQPGRTLYWAYTGLHRDTEACAALDAAIAQRPEDGELLCFAADVYARYARDDRARELLARAEGRCSRLTWLRTAATLADYRPDLREALRLTLLALEETPLDIGLQRNAVRLLAETDSREAALAHLRAQIERFPHHLGLRQSHIMWVRGTGEAAAEAPLREYLAMVPDDAWAARELALVLTELNRFDEALTFADTAMALAPRDESSLGIRAHVLLSAGRGPEALVTAREALRLSVDYVSAYATLLEASPTFAEKKAALAFILEELERQVVFGDGLLQYMRLAFGILEPDELLANLRAAHKTRPDLWHAWSALICQLYDTQRAAEALPLAREAVERFPLQPRLWLDLARVHRARRAFNEEANALARGRALSPGWGDLSRELSESLQRLERYDEAQRVLEEAMAASPLDAVNHCSLADLLWRRGRDPRALELLMQAIRINPDLDGAWSQLQEYLPPGDDRAISLAEELTKVRAGETASWLRLAEMLPEAAHEKRLGLVDRALALNPRQVEAHSMRAWLLADGGRYDEALTACQPPIFGRTVPRALRARAAWVLARKGNLPAAVKALQTLTEEEPDFYWAWERIAEWSNLCGDHATERDAAEKMARLRPRSAVPLGYLAEATLKLGKRKEALAVLKRAFALDPCYSFAGQTIFNEALRTQDFIEAENTLAQLQQHLPGAETSTAELRLAAKRRKREHALKCLGTLLTVPERESNILYQAAEAFQEAGWAVEFERVLWERRADPALSPVAGAVWVRSFGARKAWGHRTKLKELDPALPFTQQAWREFASVCGENHQRGYLQEILKERRAWMSSDLEAWANVGYAYVQCDQAGDAVKWLSDWRERANLKPWMLYNLASATAVLNRDEESMEVTRHALTLPRDHTAPAQLARLAVYEAIHGNYSAAKTCLQELNFDRLEPVQRAHFSMAGALCEVAGQPQHQRADVYYNQRENLAHQYGAGDLGASVRSLFQRVDKVMAGLAGVRVPRQQIVQAPSRSPSHSHGSSRGIPSSVVWIIVAVVVAIARCAYRANNLSSNSTPFNYPAKVSPPSSVDYPISNDPDLRRAIEYAQKRQMRPDQARKFIEELRQKREALKIPPDPTRPVQPPPSRRDEVPRPLTLERSKEEIRPTTP